MRSEQNRRGSLTFLHHFRRAQNSALLRKDQAQHGPPATQQPHALMGCGARIGRYYYALLLLADAVRSHHASGCRRPAIAQDAAQQPLEVWPSQQQPPAVPRSEGSRKAQRQPGDGRLQHGSIGGSCLDGTDSGSKSRLQHERLAAVRRQRQLNKWTANSDDRHSPWTRNKGPVHDEVLACGRACKVKDRATLAAVDGD